MTRAQRRQIMRTRRVSASVPAPVGDVRLYDRAATPARTRRVDPVVRPFDRQRDHRVGRQSVARPWAGRPVDGGEVWAA